MKNAKRVQVCPNCGRRVQSNDFLGADSLPGMGAVMAASGIIACSKCGFRGPPVEVKEEDLDKIKFARKK